MVCRKFHCNDVIYAKNTCKFIRRKHDSYCLVLFVKIVFGMRNPFYEHQLNAKQIQNAIITQFPFSDQIDSVKIYLKTKNQSGISLVDYLVIQLYLYERVEQLERFVKHVHGRPCYVGISNVFPMCEIILYDFTKENDQELAALFTHPFCNDKKLRVINKLHFCLHVLLRRDELQMEIDNNVLVVTISSTQVFRFSPWEYEFTDEILKLCIDDYMAIYKAMPADINAKGSITNEAANEFSSEVTLITATHLLGLHYMYLYWADKCRS